MGGMIEEREQAKRRARRTWLRWGWRALLSAGLALVAWGAGRTETGRRVEGVAEDLRMQAREHLAPRAPHEALMLVGIDEASLQIIGQWPFPRAMHGFMMEWMGRSETTRPAVLGWDLLFVETSPRLPGEGDMDVAMTAPLAGLSYPVVVGATSDPNAPGLMVEGAPGIGPKPLAAVEGALARLPDERGAVLPIAMLGEVARPAFLDAHGDGDGVVRRLPLVVRVGESVYTSLVLECVLAYWKVGYEAVEVRPGEAVRITGVPGRGLVEIPIDDRGYYRVNHRHERAAKGEAGGMPEQSYVDFYGALAGHAEGGAAMEGPTTAGRIVVVGQVAVGLTDIGPSPLSGQSAKVFVHLNALDNILAGDYLIGVASGWMFAAALGLGLGAAWALDRGGYGWYAVVAPLALAGLAAGATGALIWGNVMAPLALPLAALVVQQGTVLTLKIREERAQRERVKGMFGTYVSPALVKRMVESGEEPRLGGVEEEITAYFSDIEGFSGFSEKLTPPQLVELMNEYLSACTDIVQAEGGTLDKYIGDALVAMYGAPLALPEHAHCAVVAALRVQKRGAELREKWRREPEKNWPEIVTRLQTRIGLNTGRAVVGNMGSHTRFNYTMMGDTVNLAARMESGAKAYGVYTMVTGATKTESERIAPGAVLFRTLDRIVVKGRSQAVEIFEAVALAKDLDAAGEAGSQTRECVRVFEEGIRLYRAQDWDGAEARFRESAKLEVNAGHSPSEVLLERVQLMRAKPPGAEWDGVWRMTSK